MTIDKKLLEILRCPVTKQQVFPLSLEQLDILNNEIISGNIFQADGNAVIEKIQHALITENKNIIEKDSSCRCYSMMKRKNNYSLYLYNF